MIKNYLKIILRFMLRQKGFSFINISGLTIGITCSLLIILYIQDELSYDKFHPDAKRIYRLVFKGVLENKKFSSAQTGTPVSVALKQEIPEVESTLRIASWATFPVRYETKAFTEEKMLLADSNFFNFFNFKLIAGHPDTVLSGERKLVITESAAKRYFGYTGNGDKSPIGKTVMLAQGYPVTVTGIAADPPQNSHIHFSLILSLESWDEARAGSWISNRVATYFKVAPDTPLVSVTSKFNILIEKYVSRELQQLNKIDLDEFKSSGNDLQFFAQPLTDIHLRSQHTDEIEVNNDIQYIYIFGSVALLITILACINFMNLSTARSASRAKEVGVRKVVGADYKKLILQFFLESYFYIGISIFLSFLLVMAIMPVFNVFTNKQLSSALLFKPVFVGIGIVFTILVGLLAGSYPAFYLAHFNPVEVLKGKLRAQLRSYGIRNFLVVFQFVISTVLIIATLVVYLQLRYIQMANIGFEKGNVINILHTKNLEGNGTAFKNELLQNPEITAASYANRLPPNVDWQSVFREVDSGKEYLMSVYEMDTDHLETMRYKLDAGRFFSARVPSDTNAIVLNETAARILGLEKFEGRKLITNYDHDGRAREVIGILKDFNFQSFREPVQPLAVVMGYEPNWEMAIRITRGNEDSKIELIRSIWNKYAPGTPFEYTFLDKNFEAKHTREKRLGQLSLLFTELVIFIACLGLYGLATFTVEQRTKEIGIRKVLGASVQNIVIMINTDFLRPVLIANLIAWPIAGWLMYLWLQEFAYRISFPLWAFILAGVITVAIALVSISFQAIKAGEGNPVDSLRNE